MHNTYLDCSAPRGSTLPWSGIGQTNKYSCYKRVESMIKKCVQYIIQYFESMCIMLSLPCDLRHQLHRLTAIYTDSKVFIECALQNLSRMCRVSPTHFFMNTVLVISGHAPETEHQHCDDVSVSVSCSRVIFRCILPLLHHKSTSKRAFLELGLNKCSFWS